MTAAVLPAVLPGVTPATAEAIPATVERTKAATIPTLRKAGTPVVAGPTTATEKGPRIAETLAEAAVLTPQVAAASALAAPTTIPAPTEIPTTITASKPTTVVTTTVRTTRAAVLATLLTRAIAASEATVARAHGGGSKGPERGRPAAVPTHAPAVVAPTGAANGRLAPILGRDRQGTAPGTAAAARARVATATITGAPPIRTFLVAGVAAPSGSAEEVPLDGRASRTVKATVLLAAGLGTPATTVGVRKASEKTASH